MELMRGHHVLVVHADDGTGHGGSAVPVKPDMTEEWAPRQTGRPSGRPIIRIATAVARIAASGDRRISTV
jgi:hypothetical protein